jgi:predicted site-specific integrase-resolvase
MGLMTEQEVAEYIGVSLEVVKRWRRNGQGPVHIKLSRQTYRYHPKEVGKWLNEKKGR